MRARHDAPDRCARRAVPQWINRLAALRCRYTKKTR